ncbi:ABC transporter permease [Acetatifactor aquisgranensis]|uniref:ABC transporter permease n=1 Tax=Acetatifactor aquisgranensis TaxID=2941233 RepID=UPI00203ECB90|nr:ABC transporter permease subunit [Acetatifactor aquisgranensis]
MKKKKRGALYYLKRDMFLYLLLLPVILYYFVFKYLPMGGIVMAFQDFNIFKGIFHSEFVGLDVFRKILKSQQFWNSVRNTLILNLSTLAVSFPLTIILALVLNEIRAVRFKKISQSLLYLPHFISWVVVAGIAQNLFNMTNGTVNGIIKSLGLDAVPFLSENGWWIFTYILCNVWKEIGWGTIIYLAALTGVDESLYEAAYLDGATKFQRIIYVTVPMIKSVAVTMLILDVSKMMSIGLDAPLLLGNTKVMAISEVISTYVYRLGIEKACYDQATAIGLFQSVVNIVILFMVDRIAKMIGEEGIL